jgi:peptidoglycan pentaglycine glycine transferase (the first glycine)
MIDPQAWNTLIASLPNPHLLQTWEWGEVKRGVGWRPIPLVWYYSKDKLSIGVFKTNQVSAEPEHQVQFGRDASAGTIPETILNDRNAVAAAALVLQRTVPMGGFAARLRLMYVPKGPLLADWDDPGLRKRVLSDLKSIAHERGAFFIKIDPDVCVGKGIPGLPDSEESEPGQAVRNELLQSGWRFSDEQIQFRNTVHLDLTSTQDDLLAAMKQKTRYNIRLAQRKGVSVRVGGANDLDLLFKMYEETALRDGFVIRDEAYYKSVWGTFLRPDSELASLNTLPVMQPLIAEVRNEPVAGLLLFHFASRAWYIYGMSRDLHREKMPNYLLQWEAIRRAKSVGCQIYDLWGAPDTFSEEDSMWGVFRFKVGLGGQVVRTLGAWDLPLRPGYYRLYTRILPRLLDLMRKRGKARTRENLERGGSL